jgi:GNAT superfamily N-acetyltransferase
VTLTFAAATPEDEPTIRALQEEAIAWLATQGTDQWQPAAMRRRLKHRAADRGLTSAIERGEVFLACEGEDVVGCLTLDEYADPEFWSPEDDPASALYVHRMIVRRSSAGRDVGRAMLDWCAREAARRGRTKLRLDAWRTNHSLHRYYERQGFHLVRTVSLEHRGSGALFERELVP